MCMQPELVGQHTATTGQSQRLSISVLHINLHIGFLEDSQDLEGLLYLAGLFVDPEPA